MYSHIFMTGVLIILGLAFIVFGIVLLRKKTITISGYVFPLIMAVALLPLIINMLSFYVDLFSILLIVLLLFNIFIIKKGSGDFMVYNCNEDMTYESIFQVLKEKNIHYEEKRGTILLPDINSEIKLGFQQVFHIAIITVNKVKDPEIRKTIIKEFRSKIRGKRINSFPLQGLVFVFGGLLLLSMFLMRFLIF